MKARHSQMVLNLGPRLDARLSDFAGPSWAAIIAAIHDLLTGKWQRCFVYGKIGRAHV